jgi:hypothetical protein
MGEAVFGAASSSLARQVRGAAGLDLSMGLLRWGQKLWNISLEGPEGASSAERGPGGLRTGRRASLGGRD